jgi:hypothetical protein
MIFGYAPRRSGDVTTFSGIARTPIIETPVEGWRRISADGRR